MCVSQSKFLFIQMKRKEEILHHIPLVLSGKFDGQSQRHYALMTVCFICVIHIDSVAERHGVTLQ